MNKKILLLLTICMFSILALTAYAGGTACGLAGCSAITSTPQNLTTTQVTLNSTNFTTNTVSFNAFCGNASGSGPCFNSSSPGLNICNDTTQVSCDSASTEYLNRRFSNSSYSNITYVAVSTASDPFAAWIGYNGVDTGSLFLYDETTESLYRYIMADQSFTPTHAEFAQGAGGKYWLSVSGYNAGGVAFLCMAHLGADASISSAECDTLIGVNANTPVRTEPVMETYGEFVTLAYEVNWQTPTSKIGIAAYDISQPSLPELENVAELLSPIDPKLDSTMVFTYPSQTESGNTFGRAATVFSYNDGINQGFGVWSFYGDGISEVVRGYFASDGSTIEMTSAKVAYDGTSFIAAGAVTTPTGDDKPAILPRTSLLMIDDLLNLPDIIIINYVIERVNFFAIGKDVVLEVSYDEIVAFYETIEGGLMTHVSSEGVPNAYYEFISPLVAPVTPRGSDRFNPILYVGATKNSTITIMTSGSNIISKYEVFNFTATSVAFIEAVTSGGHSGDYAAYVIAGPSIDNSSVFLDFVNTTMSLTAVNPNGTTRFTTDKQVVIQTMHPDINILNFQLDFQSFNGTFDTTLGTCVNCSYDLSNGTCQAEVEKVWGMFQNYRLNMTLTSASAISMTNLTLECRTANATVTKNANCASLFSAYGVGSDGCVSWLGVPGRSWTFAANGGIGIDMTGFTSASFGMGNITPTATCEQIACEVTGVWKPGDDQEFVMNKTITVTAI